MNTRNSFLNKKIVIRLAVALYLMLISFPGYAQNTFRARILDQVTEMPLIGVNAFIKNTTIGSSSDTSGLIVIQNIPSGKQTMVFSSVGYENLQKQFNFPLKTSSPITIYLKPEEEALEEVTISATRSSRTIEDIPTRIEAITSEELVEKAIMNSSNIAMVLRESTGIQMQQTSANSANASIRIQGLDGRHTQLLRDGFPLYGGFSSGLSIMQIPPLDLKQFEIIKGSASTLYGGGAIAGLVNLVSKTPEDGRELSLMVNQTSALGTTVNGFYADKFDKIGLTLYTSANRQTPYDPNDDGFSDIPKIRSISFNPKVYYYFNDNTTLSVGLTSAFENREGGDIEVIEDNETGIHTFSEKNVSERISSQLTFEKHLSPTAAFIFKNSVSYFDRKLTIPDYKFNGRQIASFSEATYTTENENRDWIIGANLYTDNFDEEREASHLSRDYQNATIGAFAQNNWDFKEQFTLETGLRTDYNTDYGTFVLPRLSLLYKISPRLTSRLGGGMGYKVPTVFTEEAERLSFQNVLPIAVNEIEAETSIGGNFDLNFSTPLGEKTTFSINQLFFYTQLSNALVLEEEENSNFFRFSNADGHVNSRGFETNLNLTYLDFKLFLNYAFIDVRLNYDNINKQKPLTPKHNVGFVLMYETEDKWRIGYELYYTGEQYLSSYTQKRDFVIMGLMAMRTINNISLFLNFENFTDTRQSQYQPMVLPPHEDPSFTEIWAPTDGFVVNGGIIVNLFKD